MVLIVLFGVPISVMGLIVLLDVVNSRKCKNQYGGGKLECGN